MPESDLPLKHWVNPALDPELVENASTWKRAFLNTGGGIWVFDVEAKGYFISRESGSMLGYSSEDLPDLGTHWLSLIHPDDLQDSLEVMERYLRGEVPAYCCEYRMRCKDGLYRWIHASGRRDSTSVPGAKDRIIGTHQNVHVDHERAARIQEIQEMQGAILRNATYTVVTVDRTGLITSFNPAAEKMLGYRAEEVVNKKSPAIWHEGSEVASRAEKLSLELGKSIQPGFGVFTAKADLNLEDKSEWTYIRKDGVRMTALLSVTALRNNDDTIFGYLGIAVDLTERKKAESEARERESVLAKALAKVENQKFALDQHALVAITDLHGTITYANQKFCDLSKYPHEDLIGKNHRILNSGFHPREFFREMYKTIHAGKVWRGEIKNRAKDGSYYWVDSTLVPNKDDKGNIFEFIAIRTDITNRKRNEEILEERKVILEATTESHPGVLISCIDLKYRFLNFNSLQQAELEKLFGARVAIGTDFLSVISDENIKNVVKRDFDKCFAGETHENIVEYENSFWHTRYSPLINLNGEIFGASFFSEDISQRRAEELEQSRLSARLSLACKAGGIGIWEYDIIQNSLIWDDQMYVLYGIAPETFSGVYEAWRNGLHPEDIAKSEAELTAAIAGTKGFDTEFRVLWPDGSTHNIRALARVICDDHGKALRMIGTNWDITDRKRAETLLMTAMHAAEESSRSKSEFLSNMSHELRTPLNSVIGFSNILLKNKGGRLMEQDLTLLGRIADNGKHLLNLINSILDLSKIEAGRIDLEISDFDLRAQARVVLDQFEPQVRGSNVSLKLEAHPESIPMKGDSFKFRQVLINLVGNALKFTESGSVTIRIVTDPENGTPLRLEVADTGIGIPPDRLDKIFSAFQQADNSISRRFGGTGLGLTISRSLLSLMGFQLRVTSEEGKGSVFTIYFQEPGKEQSVVTSWSAVKADSAQETRPTGFENVSLQGKKVVVIDDEPDSCMLLRIFFEEMGCLVEVAHSGGAGMELARRIQPDLITLDLMMPVENGWIVAQKLNDDAELHQIPVLVVSIVAGDFRGGSFGILGAVEKPVSKERMLQAVIDVMVSKRTTT